MISEAAQAIKNTLVRDSLAETPISEKRRLWEEFAASVSTPPGVQIENRLVVGVPCMLLRPAACSSKSAVVYIHGGGLVEGSVNTAREWCARLTLALDQPVLSIDYRLAPEYPFPAARDDVLAVCKSLSQETGYVFSGIGADSSGCALALSALIVLRDCGLDLPKSCFMLSPSVDFIFRGNSINTNATFDLVVDKQVLEYYAGLYAQDHDRGSAEVSPLYGELHGLPRMLLHVDESELLLDDARRLEIKINECGGAVRLVVSQGLWHVWPVWGDFPEARTALQQIVDHAHAAERGD